MSVYAWKEICRKVYYLLLNEFQEFPVLEILAEWIIGCALIGLLYRIFGKKQDEQRDKTSRNLWMWLYVYICFVVNLTILRREPGSRGEINLQLILGNPFIDHGGRRAFCYAMLNGMLFIPFGYLIRKLEIGKRHALTTLLVCLTMTLAIELIQQFTGRGNFELTDLVMNTVGGWLGMLLGQKKHKRQRKGSENEANRNHGCTGRQSKSWMHGTVVFPVSVPESDRG